MNRRPPLRLAIGIAVALGFTWLVARQVDGERALAAMRSIHLGWAVAALAAFLAGYAVRIARWRLLLAPRGTGPRWRDCAGPLLAGFALNNLLPLRAGDVARSVAFTGQLRRPAAAVLGSLVVERLLDLGWLLLLFAALTWWTGMTNGPWGRLGAGAALAGGALAQVLLLAPSICRGPLTAAIQGLGRLAPALAERAKSQLQQAMDVLGSIGSDGIWLRLQAATALAWFAEGSSFFLMALACPSLDAPRAAWLTLPTATLGTLLPGTPGHVGTFDWFALQAMIAGGNGGDAAAAYVLVLHLLVWLPPTLLGGGWLLFRASRKPARGEIVS